MKSKTAVSPMSCDIATSSPAAIGKQVSAAEDGIAIVDLRQTD